jgi:hypothetical protein
VLIAAMSIQGAIAISATCGAGFLMVSSGLHKRMLERPTLGVCRKCGRRLERRDCEHCSRRTS